MLENNDDKLENNDDKYFEGQGCTTSGVPPFGNILSWEEVKYFTCPYNEEAVKRNIAKYVQ